MFEEEECNLFSCLRIKMQRNAGHFIRHKTSNINLELLAGAMANKESVASEARPF
jgi:hypothetical protein